MFIAMLNPFEFFAKSDLAGQVIFVILCFLSLMAWTTMIGKYLQLKRIRDNNEAFSKILAKVPLANSAAERHEGSPYATLTSEAISALARARQMEVPAPDQMTHVANAIQRALNSACLAYESKMILLGSVVSGAPFLGCSERFGES
jgi:biopolymer transport protein ExbB/TolQ